MAAGVVPRETGEVMEVGVQESIRLGHSFARDARQAARELYEAVAQPEIALVIFFCSNEYDLGVLAEEMERLFGSVQVVGCTTAGEIGPGGYREHSLAGVSFSAAACTVVSGHIDELRRFEVSDGEQFCQNLLQALEAKAPQANSQNSFGFLLIDGLSLREEAVARAFQNALGKLPVVGGSAGDGLKFSGTHVYVDKKFRQNCAALILITTPLPFKVFKTQHFVPTDRRLVITEADPGQRVVKEINGFPAAEEYARIVGIDARDVDPKRFAASPVVVMIGGNNYVRSIQKANSDGSLTFYCAIEEGLVLRVAQGVNLVENLERTLTEVGAEIGPPQLVLSCDCILRRLEIVQNHMEDRVGSVLRRHHALGFSTYGEQFCGVHVNQTLSGVALGAISPDGQHE
jgi:hypothetical protein